VTDAAGYGEIDAGAAQLGGTQTIGFVPAGAGEAWAPMNVEGVVLEELE
jgi:hypothetical protein